MTVWSWIRLTVCLWLLRKAVKLTGWLLLLLILAALWPVTLVTAAGYTAAWLRGWPPARLRRAAAATLTVTAVYTVAVVVGQHAGRAAALPPARAWRPGWHHPGGLSIAQTFLLLAPAAIPAGLALASLLWAWRNYAVMAGIGGRMASAPVTFDARQWRRQVGAAERGNIRDLETPTTRQGRRNILRSWIRHNACQRRMCGTWRQSGTGAVYVYYKCRTTRPTPATPPPTPTTAPSPSAKT